MDRVTEVHRLSLGRGGCICFHGNALFNSLVRGALDAAMRLIIPNALRKFSSEEACLLGHVLILFCQSNLWIGSLTLSWKCRSSGSLAVGSWFSNFLKPLLWYWKGMSVPERKQQNKRIKPQTDGRVLYHSGSMHTDRMFYVLKLCVLNYSW